MITVVTKRRKRIPHACRYKQSSNIISEKGSQVTRALFEYLQTTPDGILMKALKSVLRKQSFYLVKCALPACVPDCRMLRVICIVRSEIKEFGLSAQMAVPTLG